MTGGGKKHLTPRSPQSGEGEVGAASEGRRKTPRRKRGEDDDDWGRDSIVLLFTREPVRTIVFIGFFDYFTREVDP